ncbi:hypothetical protein CLU79DRAFT_727333 [Phycomyces nitens]|nr:hypothetical protein CLU79DRAFT_727333 [Phycomyces nitens]
MADDSCTVCLENFSVSPVSVLPCRHVYHHSCILSWIVGGATRCPNCNVEVGPIGIIGPLFASFGQNNPTSPDLTEVNEISRIKHELMEFKGERDDLKYELRELKEEKERMKLELRQIGEITKAKSAMNEGLFNGWKQSKDMWRSLPNERLPIILASYQTKLALADDERRRESMANRSATSRIQELKIKNTQLKRQVAILEKGHDKSPPPYCHCGLPSCTCPVPLSAPLLRPETAKPEQSDWENVYSFKEQRKKNNGNNDCHSKSKRPFKSDPDDVLSTTDDGSGYPTSRIPPKKQIIIDSSYGSEPNIRKNYGRSTILKGKAKKHESIASDKSLEVQSPVVIDDDDDDFFWIKPLHGMTIIDGQGAGPSTSLSKRQKTIVISSDEETE